MKALKVWKRIFPILLFVFFQTQILLVQSTIYILQSDIPEVTEWIEWDSSCRLDNNSNWIELPDLAPAPRLNCERTNLTLQLGESYNKTFGFIAGKQIYIYLNVQTGDLELLVFFENGTLFHNSSNYPGYDEYITFTPKVHGNFMIQITHDPTDEIPEAEGILYIRQNMIFAGAKISYSMDANSENISSIFFRVDQDFSRIEVIVQNSTTLEIGNISIFHDQSYYDRDDFYSFIFYDITYEIIYPSELYEIENQRYQGRQTLQWACQQVPYTIPLKEVSVANQSTFLNITADLPYKPELALVEEGTGFPAGSYVQITSKSGIGDVEIFVYPVVNEDIIDADSPTDDDVNDDANDDDIDDNSAVNPNDILNLDSIASFSLKRFSILLVFSIGIIVTVSMHKTRYLQK